MELVQVSGEGLSYVIYCLCWMMCCCLVYVYWIISHLFDVVYITKRI